MKKRIFWPNVEQGGIGKYNSPFQRGKRERALQLTFHISSFENLSEEDALALLVLRNLSKHDDLDYLNILFDDFPYSAPNFLSKESLKAIFAGSTDLMPQMRVRHYHPEDMDVSGVTWDGKNQYGQTFFSSTYQLNALGSNLVKMEGKSPLIPQTLYDDLIIISSHQSEKRDILVTLSPFLINNESDMIREANPRTPREAARIVGLFLRSRHDFTLDISDGVRIGTSRGGFYWVLTRSKLPNMWRYFSGCVRAEDYRKDQTLFLGQSILNRCRRALEVRDAIGIEFYKIQNNDTRDAIISHFDYLTLLLGGAFDALARVASRAYQIIKPSERLLNFRNKEFLTALNSKGAMALVDYVSETSVRALLEVIYQFRNTIHGASLTALGLKQQFSKEEDSYMTLYTDLEKLFQETVQPEFDLNAWGLVPLHVLSFEPYTLSCTLINEAFQVINRIASETEITRLFPAGIEIPKLIDKPPDEELFNEPMISTISNLG